MNGIIYKAKNKINGKIYIGKTIQNLSARIVSHISVGAGFFGRSLKKYGIQSFEFSIIDSSQYEDILAEKEIYWISYYNSKVPVGYNLTDGGEGMSGFSPSAATRKKWSEQRKGKRLTEDHKRKIGAASSQQKRSPRSEETKQKLRLANLGKKYSVETRKKHSDRMIGNHHRWGRKESK